MKKGLERQFISGSKLALWALLLSVLWVVAGWPQTSPPPPAASQPAIAPAAAAPAKPKSPETPPDKVVMRVGDQSVTAGELEGVLHTLPIAFQRTVATQGMKTVGDQYATLLALSQKAVTQKLDQTPEFKQKLALQRVEWLAQAEYKELADNVKVAPDEINQYYTQHQKDFEEVHVRQVSVLKQVPGPKGAAAGRGLPEPEARTRIEAIRTALAAGQDPAKVADQYKMPNVVFFDPNPRPFRHGQLAGESDKAAWSLKDGQVSEIQNNPMNLYFLQVVKHQQPVLKDVDKEIESKIKQQKFDDAVSQLKKSANIWLDPEYFAPPKPPAPAPQAKAESPSPKPESAPAKPQAEATKP